jgi:mycofactocin system glycosyltransferase
MAQSMRYSLDASVRRVGAGRVLIGGSPLKLLRLTERGADLLDAVEQNHEVPSSAANNALIDRLLDGGLIHPHIDTAADHFGADASAAAQLQAQPVTIVIPAYNSSADELTRLVAQCHASHHAGRVTVIVVDDASQPPIGDVPGATIIRRDTNAGPGAARSSGLDHVSTPFVAFVDTDVELPPDWLQPLLAHFVDARAALVAPRVASAPADGLLARYEALHSPLDVGSQSARVRAGTRVSYVPAAALVCRVSALREVGGFDDSMRVGEDVDLVWRLDEAGWRVRYDPTVTVLHLPRASLSDWARQRYGYGSSAAPLATRHPGALAPVRVSGWSAATWLAVAAGWPVVGGLIASVTTAMLVRKLRAVPDGAREAVRLAGLGHLFAVRSLASAITRVWWPLAAIAAMTSKRARRIVLIAAIAPATIDWVRTRPAIDPLRYVGLRLLDDACYGAGVVRGAAVARSIEALVPDFTSWPRTSANRRSPLRSA